jgi:hypothetical protein
MRLHPPIGISFVYQLLLLQMAVFVQFSHQPTVTKLETAMKEQAHGAPDHAVVVVELSLTDASRLALGLLDDFTLVALLADPPPTVEAAARAVQARIRAHLDDAGADAGGVVGGMMGGGKGRERQLLKDHLREERRHDAVVEAFSSALARAVDRLYEETDDDNDKDEKAEAEGKTTGKGGEEMRTENTKKKKKISDNGIS